MSIWKEIKKSINSDLDVPLNERLRNKRALLSSDENVLVTYTVPSNGSIRVKVLMNGSFDLKNSTKTNSTSTVSIIQNNNTIDTLEQSQRSFNVLFAAGDIFEFKNLSNGVAIIDVYAIEKDLSGIKIL